MSDALAAQGASLALDPNMTAGLIYRHIQTRAQLDELELINVQEGAKWLKRQKNADLFTEHFVSELHKRLFGKVWKWAGRFRSANVRSLDIQDIDFQDIDFQNTDFQKPKAKMGCEAKYIAVELRCLLNDTRHWIDHRSYPPRELAARFHHLLVSIRPFPHGNGRHARLMTDAVLRFVGEAPVDWSGGYGLSSLPAQRKRYIAALCSADVGDYRPLLRFIDA